MSAFRFDDRVVVITGGATGIGLAAARAFLDAGARVAVCGRRDTMLEAAAKQLDAGDRLLAATADVTDESTLESIARQVRARWDGLHVWVNNAGVNERRELPDAEPDHVSRLLDTNVRGVVHGCRVALRHFRQGGAIVNVSSYLAQHAGASGTLPLYCATKGAVSALTRALAVRHGPEGVRVNAVCPAFVPTDLNREVWQTEGKDAPRFAERYPLRRVGRPEDVASAILFLAADEAGWITGQELVVDGGISAV